MRAGVRSSGVGSIGRTLAGGAGVDCASANVAEATRKQPPSRSRNSARMATPRFSPGPCYACEGSGGARGAFLARQRFVGHQEDFGQALVPVLGLGGRGNQRDAAFRLEAGNDATQRRPRLAAIVAVQNDDEL